MRGTKTLLTSVTINHMSWNWSQECIVLVISEPIPKLYIPSTINIWKKLLSTAIWADKNRQIDFYPEFIQFRMHFHPKNLKSEWKNPWFKPWFNILMKTQCATVKGQCLEYLGYITLTYLCPNPWHDSLLDQNHFLHQILANKLCWHCHWVRIPISNVKEQCHLTGNDLQQIQGGSLWIEHRDLGWLSSVRFKYKPGYRSCDLLKIQVLSLVENLPYACH